MHTSFFLRTFVEAIESMANPKETQNKALRDAKTSHVVNHTTEATKTPQEALKWANPPQSGRVTTTQTENKLQAQTDKRIHWIKEKKYKERNIELNDNNSIFYIHTLLFSLV